MKQRRCTIVFCTDALQKAFHTCNDWFVQLPSVEFNLNLLRNIVVFVVMIKVVNY